VVGSSTCNAGLHMVDIRQPKRPRFAGCFAADGYTHDVQCVVYRGPDTEHRGREICMAANEDTLTIVDVSDKKRPRMLSRTGYTGVGYTHQGWFTEDQTRFLLDDEFDEMRAGHGSRTYVWDVSNLDAPRVIGTHTGASHAIDHNQFIRGNLVYQANYTSGLRILDLEHVDEAHLHEVGFFDVVPQDDDTEFDGAWNVYPYFGSGIVLISGINQGLFVVRPEAQP
jgi:choice-of-anchor B domain-containing protein